MPNVAATREPEEIAPAPADRTGSRRPVVQRAFDVLDCFNGATETTVAEVCKQTALPPATVHRLLTSLVEWGAVERLSHGRYRLGARLWKLAAGSAHWLRLREIAQPYLVDLHLDTHATTYLVLRDGLDGLHTDRITRVKVTNPGIFRAIRRKPLYRTGAGRVLLAYSARARAELEHSAEDDPALAKMLPTLLIRLDEIRAAGVAVSQNDGATDRVTVAAPIFDREGDILASIAAAFPTTRISHPSMVVPRVVSTARRLSLDVGQYDSDLRAPD